MAKKTVKKKTNEAQNRYQKEKQTVVHLKFHNEMDKDILEYFNTIPSKLTVVREAVREYMENHK